MEKIGSLLISYLQRNALYFNNNYPKTETIRNQGTDGGFPNKVNEGMAGHGSFLFIDDHLQKILRKWKIISVRVHHEEPG